MLEKIKRIIAISITFIIFLLCEFSYVYLVAYVHIVTYPLCLRDPFLPKTPFELEIGKVVRRMQGDCASVRWRNIRKGLAFFKLGAVGINSV